MRQSPVLRITESAVMISLACVLSLLKLAEMPAGGSVTFASMLPVVILAYRYGTRWGILCSFSYGVLQQLLGLKTLSYVSGWQSVLAVIFLDYLIAFGVIGLAGVFRRAARSQAAALAFGSVLVCVLRYFCHVISGATVWAGLSIPTEGALTYSLGYNLTYMLPETLILVIAAVYIGSFIDFTAATPSRMRRARTLSALAWGLFAGSGAVWVGALSYDTVTIFYSLQSQEGLFDFSGFAAVNWLTLGIVNGVCLLCGTVLFLLARRVSR